MLKSLILVGLGGGFGAMARHLSSLAALRLLGPNWPWGTIFVNIAGSLLMGFLVAWMALKLDGGRDLRLLLATGALGGFTTFSAFSLETALMIERKEWANAGLYAGLSVVLCVMALFCGLFAARRLFA